MTSIRDIEIAPDDLPLWMRRARESVDWGVLVVGMICALIGWAFLFQPGLPLTNGSENWVYMTENYAEVLQEGRLYPRWNAYANYGYGAPSPHFTPPMAPYTAALIQLFFTDNSVEAVRILYVVSLCLAGMLTYAFVLREAGARVAMVAAIAYVYSPYVGIIAPHLEGDLSAVIASALLPTLLWSVNRLIRINGVFDFVLVITLSALLILTNTLWAVSSILLALTFATYQLVAYKTNIRLWFRVLLAIAIGLCLSSFYWLPALLETDLVRWQTNRLSPQQFHLELETLWSPFRRVDLNELVPSPHYSLGLPLIILILISLAIFLRFELFRKRRVSFSGFFLITGTVIMLTGVTRLEDATWLLGIISFCFAVGLGLLRHIYEWSPADYKRLFIPTLIVMILILAAPVWLSPRLITSIEDTSVEAQLNYEILGFGVAASPRYADYPVTTAPTLPVSPILMNGYQSDNVIRIPLDQRSRGRVFDMIQSETHQDQYQICFSQRATIEVLRAYFTGWRVDIDDAPVSTGQNCTNIIDPSSSRAILTPEEETGLIEIDIPSSAQQRILTISLGDTEIRRAAWIISWTTVALIILVSLLRLRRSDTSTYIYFPMPDVSEARLLFIIVIAFATVIFVLASPYAPLTLHATPGYSLNNTVAAPTNRTNGGIQLISYRFNNTTFTPDDHLEVFLAWRKNLTEPLQDNFFVQVYIRDLNQQIHWQESDYQQPGGYPTRRWIRGYFVSDRYELPLDNLIPGEYEVVIEVYVCEPECVETRRVTFFDESQQIGQEFVLPQRIQIR